MPELQGQPPEQPAGPLAPNRARLIRAFGILGVVLGPTCVFGVIFGILAMAYADREAAEIAAGRMDPTGAHLIQTGRSLGTLSVALTILSVLLWLLLLSPPHAGSLHVVR
jgi:hypothetical protein